MKTLTLPFAIAAVVLCSLSTPAHAGDLDGFLGEINVRARADLGGFRADLSATFGVSSGDVDELLLVCDTPGDAYLTLRIGEVANVSVDRVVAHYRAHKGRGWGAIAKDLGIKPGSPEFHALKKSRLSSPGKGTVSAKPHKSNGSGKAKGRR